MLKRISLLFLILFLFQQCRKDDKVDTALPGSYSNRAVGASANDLLSGASYSTLTIELQYMPGYAPDASALSDFQSLLNTLLNKSSGVQITQKQIASGNKATYTLDDVKLIEKANRTAYASGSTIAVYILITDGTYTDNAVLGIS